MEGNLPNHGPFEVVKYLYSFTNVAVFQSRSDDHQDIAVKALTLSSQPTEAKQQVEKLEESMRRLLTLQHENVVTHIRGIRGDTLGQHNPVYYVVMEYCSGGSLHKAVRDCPVRGELLGKWLHDILSGLAYLHKRNIVHRDLKGSNIVLTSEDRATCGLKICDLGAMAAIMASVTKQDEVSHSHGTYAFMSPEIIDPGNVPDSVIGRKTDMWSFGCVVIETITGQQPQFFAERAGKKFRLNSDNGAFRILAHVADGGRPELYPEWPANVYRLIDRCLQRNTRERPTAQELLEENVTVAIAAEEF